MTNKPTYEELELRIRQLEERYDTKSKEIQKLKEVFFSNISHEIRTPLNSIVGFSRLLAEDRVTPIQKPRYVKYIQQGTNRLLNYVEEILEYSMLKTGDAAIDSREFTLDWFMQRAKETMEGLRPESWKGPRIQFNFNPAESKIKIHGDVHRMVQSLKYIFQFLLHDHEPGNLEICLTLIANGAVEINMTDQRPNIGMLRSLFQPGPGDRTDSPEMINIGLSIAKETIERMGGEMWMCRNEFGGYSVNIILPVGTATVNAASTAIPLINIH